MTQTIAVLDFGSQYTQVIARRDTFHRCDQFRRGNRLGDVSASTRPNHCHNVSWDVRDRQGKEPRLRQVGAPSRHFRTPSPTATRKMDIQKGHVRL